MRRCLYKEIKINNGMNMLVDSENYYYLNQFHWIYTKGYAVRLIGGRKNRKVIYAHREIANTPDNMFTDHINGNTLDNRKCNLRICTKSQNSMNSKLRKDNTSGCKGVHFYAGKWVAIIHFCGKKIHIGRFFKINDAIRARKNAEVIYHGEYARR